MKDQYIVFNMILEVVYMGSLLHTELMCTSWCAVLSCSNNVYMGQLCPVPICIRVYTCQGLAVDKALSGISHGPLLCWWAVCILEFFSLHIVGYMLEAPLTLTPSISLSGQAGAILRESASFELLSASMDATMLCAMMLATMTQRLLGLEDWQSSAQTHYVHTNNSSC